MRLKLAFVAVVLTGVTLLTGCSSGATPNASASPSAVTKGTVKMPGAPVVPTASPTMSPTPMPSGSATPAPFPSKGVDPQGVERDKNAEARFLGLIGYGGEPLLDEKGRTYVSVIEAAEGKPPAEDYLLNIVYAGCAEALADTAATPLDQMVQRIVNETAAELNYAVADEVMASGYAPVIRTGLTQLCGTKFASLAQKVG